MIQIVGVNGNMAQRYGAILTHIHQDWSGWDVGQDIKDGDGYIVATPTRTHVDVIRSLMHLGKPILCEKPVTKNLSDLEKLLYDCEKAGTKLQMISQYDYLLDRAKTGPTVYDYYKHGSDGLYWDCINIIYHAQSSVLLKEKSPIWTCIINGHQLSLSDMDRAYICMLTDWTHDPKADYDRIWRAHDKVYQMEVSCKKS